MSLNILSFSCLTIFNDDLRRCGVVHVSALLRFSFPSSVEHSCFMCCETYKERNFESFLFRSIAQSSKNDRIDIQLDRIIDIEANKILSSWRSLESCDVIQLPFTFSMTIISEAMMRRERQIKIKSTTRCFIRSFIAFLCSPLCEFYSFRYILFLLPFNETT